MNQVITLKGARLIAIIVSLSFLAIHIYLFLMFRRNGVTPMMYYNVFSIVFYLAMLFVSWRYKLRFFVAATYLEVLAHMSLAVYFVGWENGFQITIIGMNILLFFSEYLGRSIEGRYVRALPFGILGMCMYLGAFIVSQKYAAPYSLPPNLSFWLQIAWGVIVFVINLACLEIFVYLSFNSEAILSEKVVKDKLTGLPNRYYISNYLSSLEKYEQLDAYWVAMVDIDDFKKINDTYGHNFGDVVLKTMADIIVNSISDVELCRWGGEEFIIVGKLGGGMQEQHSRLDKLRSIIADTVFSDENTSINLTITIGVAAYEKGQSIDDWINLADKKMYLGKYNGKNQVVS